MQRFTRWKSGADEQLEYGLQGAQDAQGPQRQGCGEWSGNQQGHDVRVGQRDAAEGVAESAEHVLPVAVTDGRDLELGEHQLDDTVEQVVLAGGEPVQPHRVAVESRAEPAH